MEHIEAILWGLGFPIAWEIQSYISRLNKAQPIEYDSDVKGCSAILVFLIWIVGIWILY